MRYEYDEEADCGYIYINEGCLITVSAEITDNIIVDYAVDGSIVGIELISTRTLSEPQTLLGIPRAEIIPRIVAREDEPYRDVFGYGVLGPDRGRKYNRIRCPYCIEYHRVVVVEGEDMSTWSKERRSCGTCVESCAVCSAIDQDVCCGMSDDESRGQHYATLGSCTCGRNL